MPTRQEQKQAVLDVVSPAAPAQSIFDLREQYFAAAAKAGATASALALAINAYLIAASNQRDRKPGSGAALDEATTKLEALKAQQPIDAQAATDAHEAFDTLWQTGHQAWMDLLTNPGAIENTSGVV